MGIKIITDSSCDLTREYIDNNNIGLLSLVLNLNGKVINNPASNVGERSIPSAIIVK